MSGDGLADNLSVNGLIGDDPHPLAGMPLQHTVEKDEFAALFDGYLGSFVRIQGDDASTRQLLTRQTLKADRDGERSPRGADGFLLDDAGAESVDLEGRVVVVQGDADVADVLGASSQRWNAHAGRRPASLCHRWRVRCPGRGIRGPQSRGCG